MMPAVHLDPAPFPSPRAAAGGRAARDPACAGCLELSLFRALRRAGLDVQGGTGCEPDANRPFTAAPGRWAAVVGARRILPSPRGALAEAARAGARLLILADRDGTQACRAAASLAAAGARASTLDLADLAATEAAVRRADVSGGAGLAVLVALSPCARRARRGAPRAIGASRCNRCGACLSLGCPALSDPGGEAIALDPAVCAGCGLCEPLCRARAIGR